MADRGFLAWPFFEAKHRAFADKVEGWCHLNSVDTADLDSECRRLVRSLGEAGLLKACVETEFVRYPGGSHMMLRNGPVQHRIDYYTRIAPVLLPHIGNRGVTLRRFPNGVDGQSFFEKRCASHRPDWVGTFPGPGDRNGTIEYCALDSTAALACPSTLGAR